MSKNKKPVSSEIAISVQDVHKSFKLPTERAWGLKQAIFNRLKGVKASKSKKFFAAFLLMFTKANFLVLSVATAPANPRF